MYYCYFQKHWKQDVHNSKRRHYKSAIKFSGVPEPDVLLVKDGVPVSISQSPDTHGTKYVHVIKNAQPSDTGVLVALATNPLGTAQSTALLSVYMSLRPAQFITTPYDVNLLEGSDHVVTAVVTGIPKPVVNVTNKMGVLVGEGQMRVVDLNTWMFTIILTDVKASDFNYTVAPSPYYLSILSSLF